MSSSLTPNIALSSRLNKTRTDSLCVQNGDQVKANGQSVADTADRPTEELERLTKELTLERRRRQELETQLAEHSQQPQQRTESSDQSAELSALKSELEELREIRAREKEEADLRLEEVEEAKSSIEQQYQTLRDRVTQIRSTLGDRMKADAVGDPHIPAHLHHLEELEWKLTV